MPMRAAGTSMRTARFVFPLLLLVISFFTAKEVKAQESTDQAQVLQQCIGLSSLQALYPKNADGSYKALHVMQHGISFPENIGVSHQGKPLLFINKSYATSGSVEAYFLFHQFQVTDGKAWVEFVYYHKQNQDAPMMQVVMLELQKTGSTWTITKTKTEGRNS